MEACPFQHAARVPGGDEAVGLLGDAGGQARDDQEPPAARLHRVGPGQGARVAAAEDARPHGRRPGLDGRPQGAQDQLPGGRPLHHGAGGPGRQCM